MCWMGVWSEFCLVDGSMTFFPLWFEFDSAGSGFFFIKSC
jgi:hypothetical protein